MAVLIVHLRYDKDDLRCVYALTFFEKPADLQRRFNRLHKRLDGKALTTLSTATGQNSTTGLSGHTSTETMALSALMGVRLIGALHR